MKTHKEEIRKVIDNVICDCCGQSTDTMNMGPSWATLEATWGYGSKHDGTEYNIDLCENCFTEVIDFIKKKRKIILGPFNHPYNHDPLTGKSYFSS